ncbi:arginine biosynthesis bifunctional protein ArgJ [Arenicella chitinivorans]|uniref:Arginine biosynthesis bifunctional protein ArgJ n=1 Tax=Arenicella chitinivorans TaxID=1329800 RepID=A0A918RRF6_9GAMM|nr:bifunctional glutamate N-acetyltransferase/amino-acid acetyltransferase ArgJ [Arenicella chitinivorans]GHA05954.1 arginine biosynthesis bifunctional protein ArgJ [Arenicella chitinivorans]
MAVGLNPPAKLAPVQGIELGIAEAGIRYSNRADLVVLSLCEGSTCAAVFTKNKCCAAPVTLARDHLAAASVRALVINSGNANAVTGETGMRNAEQSCAMVAQAMGVDASQVLPFSTGVIGEQLNMSAMTSGIPQAVANLDVDNWLSAAEALMTTDTIAKAVSTTVTLAGKPVTITGMAKGSGMICPNMATMLAYVATDAALPQALLQECLHRGVDDSFNRITVDGDTSTNDALVLMATGKSGFELKDLESEVGQQFYNALERVLVELATAIVRDAEGATKFVRIDVRHAERVDDAKAIAFSIAHSPLVKTALFASDPNWGRILMALGKADVSALEMSRVNIQIGDVALIVKGEPATTYHEALGKQVFSQAEIGITIDLGLGAASFHVWTSDLSHDYVSINADYRS